jgi:hypothetical protein
MIVAKIYTTLWETEPYTQEEIDSELTIDEDLMTFDVAKFQISLIENIEENQKIELYEVDEV